MGAPMMGGGGGGGARGPVGQIRNPVMVMIISYICFIYAVLQLLAMMGELKAYLQKDEIVPWHLLIPYYNIYLLVIKVPAWVREAKQKAGCANPEPMNIVMYLFLGLYALPADLNEVWQRSAHPG